MMGEVLKAEGRRMEISGETAVRMKVSVQGWGDPVAIDQPGEKLEEVISVAQAVGPSLFWKWWSAFIQWWLSPRTGSSKWLSFQNFDALSEFLCPFRISMHFEHFEHLGLQRLCARLRRLCVRLRRLCAGLRRLCARLHRLSARLRSSEGNVFFELQFSEVFLSKVHFCEMYPTCVSSKLCEFIF